MCEREIERYREREKEKGGGGGLARTCRGEGFRVQGSGYGA